MANQHGQTEREIKTRGELKERKPLAYAKIIRHPEKIANKESVALIQLQCDYRCNFKCKHCAIERFKQRGGRSLAIADIERIADQADAMGLASICISGGEPLIFPNLKDIVDAIGPERFVISMDTNGSRLDVLQILGIQDLILGILERAGRLRIDHADVLI
ncbi:MAG: Radical SAM domain protein, partial [Candidatus Wolfebacteria bacterium GW2011_GWA1_47_6]